MSWRCGQMNLASGPVFRRSDQMSRESWWSGLVSRANGTGRLVAALNKCDASKTAAARIDQVSY